MRAVLSTPILFVLLCAITTEAAPADDLKTLVDRAIASDIKILDDIVKRHDTNKLKPAEKLKLFGKKEQPKPKRVERLEQLRQQINAGTFSFREPYGKVSVRQVVSKTEFLGSYAIESPGTGTNRPVIPPGVALFRNMPNDDVTDGEDIHVDQPMLATDRYSYNTVAAGRKTVQVIEPLSVCVKRLKKTETK